MSDIFMFTPIRLFWAMMIIWLVAILVIVTISIVYGDDTESSECFDNWDTANKFLKQYGNESHQITVPCPMYDYPHSGDESGK